MYVNADYPSVFKSILKVPKTDIFGKLEKKPHEKQLTVEFLEISFKNTQLK